MFKLIAAQIRVFLKEVKLRDSLLTKYQLLDNTFSLQKEAMELCTIE
jgi:hypothetical protein